MVRLADHDRAWLGQDAHSGREHRTHGQGETPFIAPRDAPGLMSIVADTSFDVRQHSIEGPSGFLNVGPPDYRPKYHPSQMTLEWPNGCRALLFLAEDPEVTRGGRIPNRSFHLDGPRFAFAARRSEEHPTCYSGIPDRIRRSLNFSASLCLIAIMLLALMIRGAGSRLPPPRRGASDLLGSRL